MTEPQPLAQQAHRAFDEEDWESLDFIARRILSLDGADPVGRSYLGVALACKGHFDQSLEEHRKAVRLGPNEALTWHNYANTLRAMRQYGETTESIRRALSIDPLDFRSWQILLTGLLNRFEYEQMDVAIEKVSKMFPGERLKLVLSHLRISENEVLEFEPLARDITVSLDEDGDIAIKEDGLPIYGVGRSMAEAFEDYTEMFNDVFQGFSGDLSNLEDEEVASFASVRLKEMEEATDEVLANPETLAGIEAGLADAEAGRVVRWEGG